MSALKSNLQSSSSSMSAIGKTILGDSTSMQDPEKGAQTIVLDGDDNELVMWQGSNDPKDPYNWPAHRKYTMIALISLGGLVCTSAASVMAPALKQISKDLRISNAEASLDMSIYLLAFVPAPMIISPMSEMYGRRKLWILCHCWFIFWNAICPVGKTKGLMIAARFLAGLGGAVSVSMAGPTMADIFRADQRGQSYALVTFAPYLGAAIGPLAGGALTQEYGWPWLFWVVSISDAVIIALFAVLVHESYAPVLLAKKAKKLREATGKNYQTKFERSHPRLSQKIKTSMIRPLKLFFTRPIILLISVSTSFAFAVYVAALTTYATMWQDVYHLSEKQSSLHYIAIALGSTLGSQLTGPFMDRIWARLKAKHNGETAPEYRVPAMIPGVVLMPLGLLLYGWAVEKRLHWIVPDIGAAIMSGGMMSSTAPMYAYLIDEFAEYSASSNAACRILSNSMSFAFPVFAPSLYEKLGYGWGNGMLAFVYIAIAFPAPYLLWTWGPKIRAVGRVD